MSAKKAIVVLAGGMHRGSDGLWHTNTYSDGGDNYGVDGARLRVVAASLLFQDNPAGGSVIIASGGGNGKGGQFESIPGAPTLSSVIERELVSLGAPAKSIIEENRSISTLSQLTALQSVAEEKGLSEIIIVSNGWHLPRIRAFIEFMPELSMLAQMLKEGKLEFGDADEILLAREPASWRKLIEEARRSPSFQERLAVEAKGVEAIKAGRYKSR